MCTECNVLPLGAVPPLELPGQVLYSFGVICDLAEGRRIVIGVDVLLF